MKTCSKRGVCSSLAALLCALAGGCSDSNQTGHDHSPTTSHGHEHSHNHVAPHGGVVMVLGDEAYHLEILHDREAGRMTLYVLDGHMEDFVRLTAPSMELTCVVDGDKRPLTLVAVAQSATGETVGDTSQFAGEADWLKTAEPITGKIAMITIRGSQFTDQPFAIGDTTTSD